MVKSFDLPDDVPPIPADADRWDDERGDGHGPHVIFDSKDRLHRWRFGPRGFLHYIEYEMVPDPVDGVMVPRPKGCGPKWSDAVLRKPKPEHA